MSENGAMLDSVKKKASPRYADLQLALGRGGGVCSPEMPPAPFTLRHRSTPGPFPSRRGEKRFSAVQFNRKIRWKGLDVAVGWCVRVVSSNFASIRPCIVPIVES